MMKKTLSVLALTALSIPVVLAAGNVHMDELISSQKGAFGYTENEDINVVGFQTEEGKQKHFLIQSPILMDNKDEPIDRYYALIGDKPWSTYITGENAQQEWANLVELEYRTEDIKGTMDMKINENQAPLNTGTTYYGVIVPTNDNILYGDYSQQFCFNFEENKFATGDACETFMRPEPVTAAPEAGTGNQTEHEAAPEVVSAEEPVHEAPGADMNLANISHSVSGNVITLTWTKLPQSNKVDIKIYSREKADYIKLGRVPMDAEQYDYYFSPSTSPQEFLFVLVPSDNKGKEKRYTVNVRREKPIVNPEIPYIPPTGPLENMLVIIGVTLALYAGYRFLSRKSH